ncbi:hypothetical protein Tco_1103959 [Tanacetum coccineum]
MVPKFRCKSLHCQNHDFVEGALKRRQTGEEVAIFEMEIVLEEEPVCATNTRGSCDFSNFFALDALPDSQIVEGNQTNHHKYPLSIFLQDELE